MQLNLNLATKPYEDARAFYTRWGTAAALVAVVTVLLVFFAAWQWRITNMQTRQLNDVRQKLKELDQKRAEAEAILNRPENREVRDRSRFINALIARKAFSWTRVLQDLEKIMPPRAYVVSIKPEVTAQNELELQMLIGAVSHEDALELVRRMEKSTQFGAPRLRAESATDADGEAVRFDIAALYLPVSAQQNPQKQKEAH